MITQKSINNSRSNKINTHPFAPEAHPRCPNLAVRAPPIFCNNPEIGIQNRSPRCIQNPVMNNERFARPAIGI